MVKRIRTPSLRPERETSPEGGHQTTVEERLKRLDVLDQRLGKGQGAVKERLRCLHGKAVEEKSKKDIRLAVERLLAKHQPITVSVVLEELTRKP